MNMRDYTQEIRTVIENWPKKYCTYAELKRSLEKEGKVDTACFKSALDELVSSCEIICEKGNHYFSLDKANAERGSVHITKDGDGIVSTEDGRTFAVPKPDLKDAMEQDMVLFRVPKKESNTGIVLKVLNRFRLTAVATYVKHGKSLKLIPDDALLQKSTYTILTDRSIVPVEGLKVLCEIEQYGRRLVLRAVRVIGHKDDPGMDILSILLENGIDPEFPDDVKRQTEDIPSSVSEAETVGRKDLRDEATVTIDGDDSKDFDDAVSVVKNNDSYILKVSIADVSHYVDEGSPLDREAYRRGCSTYVTDRVVPMLPHELSNGICSLNPDEDRLTLTCEMKIDPEGNVTDYELYESVIHSHARMTYKNVNLIYEGEKAVREKYSNLIEMLEDLRDCARLIRRKRHSKGALDFDSPEAKILVDENGKPVDVIREERKEAEMVIEDCMIAANVCVAQMMNGRDIPSVYRVHGEPQAKKLQSFINISQLLGKKLVTGKGKLYPNQIQKYLEETRNLPTFPVISKSLLRCMQKAKYDNNCTSHFGLGEEEYLHFTSPIRRYPDLMVHRMLRKYAFENCIDPEEFLPDEGKCAAAAEQSSIRERASQNAEYAVEDMKKAEYMEGHINETYDGIISSVTSFGFFVQLDNTIEGLVHIHSLTDDYYTYMQDEMALVGDWQGRSYRLGQKVRITVVSASKENGTIDFELAAKKEKKGGRA